MMGPRVLRISSLWTFAGPWSVQCRGPRSGPDPGSLTWPQCMDTPGHVWSVVISRCHKDVTRVSSPHQCHVTGPAVTSTWRWTHSTPPSPPVEAECGRALPGPSQAQGPGRARSHRVLGILERLGGSEQLVVAECDIEADLARGKIFYAFMQLKDRRLSHPPGPATATRHHHLPPPPPTLPSSQTPTPRQTF